MEIKTSVQIHDEVESDLPSYILIAGLDAHVNTWKKYNKIKHYKISEVL